MQKRFFALAAAAAFVLALGCKTPPAPPPPEGDPASFLSFTGIHASDIDHVGLDFTLRAENPRSSPARATIESIRVEINGREIQEGVRVVPSAPGGSFPVDPASLRGNGESLPGSAGLFLRLELDLAVLGAKGLALSEDYHVTLSAGLDFSYGLSPPIRKTARESAVFPRILRPAFTITDIAVLKAELINTRFRVTLRVENPNPFPMELSSFRYELYGGGRFWADGREKNVLRVPPRDQAEAKLFLIMNFIGMKRELLDQIIAFQDVRYRFAGEALVSTGIEYLPEFSSPFDLSGMSSVYE